MDKEPITKEGLQKFEDANENGKWDKSKINLVENKLYIEFREKFSFRRGRINCSLNDNEGWRWFGNTIYDRTA